MGVAVDEASGLVYVADAFDDAVLVFELNGAGAICPLVGVAWGKRCQAEDPKDCGGRGPITSGSAGDVYVLDGEDSKLEEGVVDVFRPRPAGPEEAGEGSLVRVLSAGKMQAPNGVAVSASTGRVLVADSFKGAIYAYSAEGHMSKINGKGSPYGSFLKEAMVGDVAGVAVDEASGDVYVADQNAMWSLSTARRGNWEGWITSTSMGNLDGPRGVHSRLPMNLCG